MAHKGHSVKGVPKSLSVGKTAQLKIGLKKKTATTLKVTYVSSNKKVLTVDKAGKITAVKKGKAYVKVKVGKKIVKVKVGKKIVKTKNVNVK
ncbi:MAG: Ig-like domain-containing protein [Clostridiales Family XIII bacterium]|nr:Ig-like domain-containing protein [Clostridiales Family XIII bacterium]